MAGADEFIPIAIDMRRQYAATVRTSRYMAEADMERLQAQVKSEMMTLRARYVARQIDVDGVGFYPSVSIGSTSLTAIKPARV